jgi:hypothetical protein
MFKPDIGRFNELMQQLGEAFDKEPTPAQIDLYWNALKDLPWEIVEACAQGHMRFCKFFPKASELRPKGDKPPIATDPQAMDAAEKASVKTWEALRAKDPKAYWTQFKAAYLARIEVLHEKDSAEYQAKYRRCVDRCDQELFMLERGATARTTVNPSIYAVVDEDFF